MVVQDELIRTPVASSRRLMCERRKGVFRPRLTLEQTGYSGDGWQWVVWFLGGSGRLVNAGGELVSRATPEEAMRQYFDLLKRLGCRAWDGVERDGRKLRHKKEIA